jgi:hypothetical protein
MVRPRKDGTPSAPCKSPEGRPETWTIERVEQEAIALIEWMEGDGLLLNEFALKRGYLPGLFDKFDKKSEKFREAHERAMKWQELKLNKGAMFKKLNQVQAYANLCRNHGWKQEQTIEHKGEVIVNIIDYSSVKKERK